MARRIEHASESRGHYVQTPHWVSSLLKTKIATAFNPGKDQVDPYHKKLYPKTRPSVTTKNLKLGDFLVVH